MAVLEVRFSNNIEGFCALCDKSVKFGIYKDFSPKTIFRLGPAHYLTYGNHKRSINFRVSKFLSSTTLIKDNHHMFGIRVELTSNGV